MVSNMSRANMKPNPAIKLLLTVILDKKFIIIRLSLIDTVEHTLVVNEVKTIKYF